MLAITQHVGFRLSGYALFERIQSEDWLLLASVLITPGAKLRTLDKRLAKLAERFGVAYHASPTAN